MGLSRDNKKEIDSYSIILELAKSLAILQDSKVLESRIKEIYALTSDEEQKYQNAMDAIESNAITLSEIKKLRATIDADAAKVEFEKQELSVAKSDNAKKKSELDEKEKELKQKFYDLSKAQNEASELAKLGQEKLNLADKRQASLDERERSISEQEMTLKEKTDKLILIANGM